jgi:hypothetical protein
MSRIDEACQALRNLSPEMQEIWGALILDQLEQPYQGHYTLTGEQLDEVRRRMAEPNPVSLSEEEMEVWIAKLLKGS